MSTCEKRAKCLFCNDFVCNPQFLWITLWIDLQDDRQSLVYQGLEQNATKKG